MRQTKALIVEDHLSTVQSLKRMVLKLSADTWDVMIASSIEEARTKIQRYPPDIVFLDIILDQGNCFELLDILKQDLGELTFEIVFTTGHIKEFHKEAFVFSNLEYLEKPIDEKLLKKVMQNFNLKRRRDMAKLENLRNMIENKTPTIAVASYEGSSILKIPDLICCEADEGYTRFHTINNPLLIASKPLKDYEPHLFQHKFFRCHQSFMINCHYINKYHDKGFIELLPKVLINKKREQKFTSFIPVSKAKRKAFRKWLETSC